MNVDGIMETFNVDREMALMIFDFGLMSLRTGRKQGMDETKAGIVAGLTEMSDQVPFGAYHSIVNDTFKQATRWIRSFELPTPADGEAHR